MCCAALLLLILKFLVKDKALYESPKGTEPPPFWIRGLLILTCTGVSFGHGSNDGQKGMGLIMLILIGTVPTAYALNHAIGYGQIPDFAAVSTQAAHVLSGYVSPDAVMDDARNDLTEYIRTKQYTPTTALAARQLAIDISNEVQQYKSLAGVPAGQQQNVRNDMYVESEALRLMAKAKQPAFTASDNAVLANYKRHLDNSTKFIPDLGEGGGGAGAGHGHDGRLEAHCGDGGREDRQGASDVCAGRFGGDCGRVHDHRG